MITKKVWYISKYALSPTQRGPSRQYSFSKYFALKGYETILISSNSNGFHYEKFKGDYKFLKEDGFKHFILKGSKINLGFNLKRIYSWVLFEYRLLKFLKRKTIQKEDTVIVSSLSILTFLSGVYLKRKYEVKLIVEVRDIWPQTLIEFKNLNKNNPLVLLLSAIEKKAYKEADVIVGSMGNLGKHIKLVASGNEHKFQYIPMGLDTSVLSEKEIKENRNDDFFIVGYAGTIGRANKIDLILEAAKILKNKAKIKFEILGEGVFKDFYIKKYNQLKNVEFLSKVEKSKVGKFLNKCDILLNPWEDNTLYQFGVSPNKWIDYMYAAKPIIVPFNGYKNIINEAKCGEFIETDKPQLLADTILKYYKTPKKERERIGMNGRDYLEKKLTYNILSDKYIELF